MPTARTRVLALVLLPVLLALTSVTVIRSDTVQSLPSVIRWSVAIPAGPAASPVLDDARVFVVLQSGTIAAHRAIDGVEAWHVELRSDYPVAVEADRVFVASGDAIHALNVNNGSVVWRTPSGPLTAPLLVRDGWIVAATASGLAAFRCADGTKVWSRESGAQHERATIEGDNLYVPLDDGRLLALDLRTGDDRWQRHFRGAVSEVLAFADRVFAGSADKYFYALSASDGQDVWKARIGVTLRGAPVADASRVFAAGIDNVIRAFDRRSGALLWHPSVPFRPTGLVIVGTSILVHGAASELHAFDPSGKSSGKITLPQLLAAPPGFRGLTASPVMAAITGSLNEEWKLLLAEAPPPAPNGLEIAPLTALPGTPVPVEPPAAKR